MLKEKNKIKRLRKNTRLDLIMSKYCLFIQRRERIKGSRIAKRDLAISLVYCSFLTRNYLGVNSLFRCRKSF